MSICDMRYIYGGVGPLHSNVTLAGVAKAFGVRLLPEGITELLPHEKLWRIISLNQRKVIEKYEKKSVLGQSPKTKINFGVMVLVSRFEANTRRGIEAQRLRMSRYLGLRNLKSEFFAEPDD